jgi:hypothetical protein
MVLLLWGALSDERTGLSFVHAAGHCQRSLSRVQVPWDLRPYFTVSDLRLPFSSPPTTRRVTVEVFLATGCSYIDSAQATKKTPLIFVAYCCTRYPATRCLPRICLCRNLFIEPLPSNGNPCYNIFSSACWIHKFIKTDRDSAKYGPRRK